ncbi:MAG: glycogen debranching protein [Gaiellaceae bacterium]
MTGKGHSHPVGAHLVDGGVNFSVCAENATAVELLLFDAADAPAPARVVPLVSDFHFWHAFVPGAGAGTVYAFRASGPSGAPFGFDHEKALLDPYARRVVTARWRRDAAVGPGDNAACSLRAEVVDGPSYDWQGDTPLRRPLADTVVYELHVGGFTASPTSGVARPWTFAGLQEKIPYLVDLGVTAVELLPVFQFDPSVGDYWGYNPIAHFAPHDRYGTPDELRDLVKALHRAGLEIILDVVFNHTGEGGVGGPTISLRGLGNETYYMHSPSDPAALVDFSGTGNTMNVNEPLTAKLVFDCLRYWVEELHVDGFRFDLGSVLTRAPDGSVMQYPPIVELAELADELAGTKLIAEAWDAGGLYQVGAFPGRRWSEWNGRFRDDVRRFVRNERGLVGAIATRVAGSSDLYQWSRRSPLSSVNFVTCHDGFTLNDLVSYNVKHNEANGENNRDGSNDNLSWNCGFEGETGDPSIDRARVQQIKNFAVMLLVSQGVPMILAGDEARRTQHGNNNAYNQANEISWLDWDLVAANEELRRFWRLLIGFRKRHPALRTGSFGEIDLRWHGCELDAPGWSDPSSRVLAFTFGGDVHVILNMDDRENGFELPPLPAGGGWRTAFDTALPSPDDAADDGDERQLADGTRYLAAARSAVILVS